MGEDHETGRGEARAPHACARGRRPGPCGAAAVTPHLRNAAVKPLRRRAGDADGAHLWLLARIDPDGVALVDRRGKDWAARLPRLVAVLRGLPVWRVVLVGELALAGGPGRLRRALAAGHEQRLVFRLHQLADVNGVGATDVPAPERRRLLERMAEGCAAAPARHGPTVCVWQPGAGPVDAAEADGQEEGEGRTRNGRRGESF